MAATEPLYDLVLMLEAAAEDDQRQRVLADVERLVDASGVIVNKQDWGMRQMAYEIRHQPAADYHLLQFHGDRELLETLHRTLRITDGVLRFRVIKLAPGTPAPPESRSEPRPVGATAAAPAAPAPAAPEAPSNPSNPSSPSSPSGPSSPSSPSAPADSAPPAPPAPEPAASAS